MKKMQTGRGVAYLALLCVVVVWGLDPIVMSHFYQYYSATVLALVSAVLSAVFFLLFARRRLSSLHQGYWKVAASIGTMTTVASLLQKIGLQYTTPANYAFLEHLSCVVVPIAMLALARVRPSRMQMSACVLCLVGCFLLCGADAAIGVGELLCGASGLLYGLCIALTGIYVKDLDMSLYMIAYMTVYSVICAITVPALHWICIDGLPLERAVFTLSPMILLSAALYGLLTVGICWMCKNYATVHINPTAVAVLCPFSAVISTVISVAMGSDPFRVALVIGAVFVLGATVLCGLAEAKQKIK